MRLNKLAHYLIGTKETLNGTSNPIIIDGLTYTLKEYLDKELIDNAIFNAIFNEKVKAAEFESMLKDYIQFQKTKTEVVNDMNEIASEITRLFDQKAEEAGSNIEIKVECDYDKEKFAFISQMLIQRDYFFSYFSIEDKKIQPETLTNFIDVFVVLRIRAYLARFFKTVGSYEDSVDKYICKNPYRDEKDDHNRTIPIKREFAMTEFLDEKNKQILVAEVYETFSQMSDYFNDLPIEI